MSLKSEIIFYSKLCYDNKFVCATDGNISVRTRKNFILTTAADTCKGNITIPDIIKVDLKGVVSKRQFKEKAKRQKKKKPSTELKLHLYIYKMRKDVNAIVHTHPKFATAFAAARLALDKPVLPEIYLKFGSIPLAKYAMPSTGEVPESISQFVDKHNAILLSNHGLVTFGKTLEEAYFLTEKAEQFAEISFYARLLGGEKILTKQQLQKLNELKT